jgi:hypothetical protein
MRNIIIAAAAVTAVATLAAAPASAEPENWGPNKMGNQCYAPAKDSGRELKFGTWGACPEAAATTRETRRSNARQAGGRNGGAENR